MTLKEELEMVEKAKTNIQYFEKIYSYYFDRIYGYCINRTANHSLSEEVVSEVFLKAIEKIKKFNTSKQIRFGAWLYTTAHNLIIDSYRKDKKFNDFEEWDVFLSDFDIEREIKLTEYQKQITFVLRKLKPRYQKVISLRFYSDLDLEEISKIMKTSKRNVSVILFRATKDFRKKYKKFFPKSEIFLELKRYA